MNPETLYYPDPICSFLNTGFDYRGHQVRYEKYDHKHEGCIVTVNHIDGVRYPFPHRTEGAAERSAKAIIDRKEGDYDTEDERPLCPVCSGDGGFIGVLGSRSWFRCQACGLEFSREAE